MNVRISSGGSPWNAEMGKRQRRRVNCCAVFIVLIIAGSIAIGIGAAVLAVALPNVLTSIMSGVTGFEAVQTRAVEGDPARFDPIAGFASMQAFAGDGAVLVDYEVTFVRADGTLDLTATYTPGPRVDALFVVEVPPPADAPPVGAGGFGTWYQPIVIEAYRVGTRRTVSQTRDGMRVQYNYVNEGMTRDTRDPDTIEIIPLEPPTCSFVDFWERAIDAGAPADAVATIVYDEDGYEFRIRDISFTMNFSPTCRVDE